MQTTIRFLTKADEPFLWEALYHAIYRESGEKPSRSILQKPKIACYVDDWMEQSDDLGLIAENEDIPIGAAWLRCWLDDTQGFGFVGKAIPELSMSVIPGHRGKGLGTKLLHRLLVIAEKRYEAVSLSVSKSNPARRLYEREGFVPLQEVENSITMVKKFESKNAV